MVGCSKQYVNKRMPEIMSTVDIIPATRTDSLGRTRPTSYADRKPEPKPEPPARPPIHYPFFDDSPETYPDPPTRCRIGILPVVNWGNSPPARRQWCANF